MTIDEQIKEIFERFEDEYLDWGDAITLVKALIADEMIKLLDEVDKQVVGEDLSGVGKLKLQPNNDTSGMIYGQAQNELRAEQRSHLSAIRKEIEP